MANTNDIKRTATDRHNTSTATTLDGSDCLLQLNEDINTSDTKCKRANENEMDFDQQRHFFVAYTDDKNDEKNLDTNDIHTDQY